MTSSDFDPYPKRPLVPSEALRIGATLLPFGLPFGNGFSNSEIWIVMETAVPHRLAGIRPSHAEALELLATRSPLLPEADVYGPFAPPPATALQTTLDETDPTDHDDTMASRLSANDVGDVRQLHRRHADMQSLTLTIAWQHEEGKPDSVTFEVTPHTDTIFLTRGSREAFMYPRYLAVFGPEYVAKLRQDLGEPLPTDGDLSESRQFQALHAERRDEKELPLA